MPKRSIAVSRCWDSKFTRAQKNDFLTKVRTKACSKRRLQIMAAGLALMSGIRPLGQVQNLYLGTSCQVCLILLSCLQDSTKHPRCTLLTGVSGSRVQNDHGVGVFGDAAYILNDTVSQTMDLHSLQLTVTAKSSPLFSVAPIQHSPAGSDSYAGRCRLDRGRSSLLKWRRRHWCSTVQLKGKGGYSCIKYFEMGIL